MFERALRAALLNRTAYDDLTDHPEGTLHAVLVVAAAAIAFGLGMRDQPIEGFEKAEGLLAYLGVQNVVMLVAINSIAVGWVLWTAVVYVIGTRLLRGEATFRTLFRGLGLAYAPGVLLALLGVPVVGTPIEFASRMWILVAGTVAVRHVQGFWGLRAFYVTAIGWFVAHFLLTAIVLPRA